MDRATAESLLTVAEDIRGAFRRGESSAAMATFRTRYDEFTAALDWLLANDDGDAAFRLASALVPLWLSSSRVRDGIEWYGRVLPTARSSDRSRATALHDHGYLAFFAGDYPVAERQFAEARVVAERAGEPDLAALALAGSARVALNRDPAEAVALVREALAITGDASGGRGRSSAEHVLGVALQMAGDLEAARTVMTSRLDRERAAGNEFVVFSESANLSMVERQLGNLDRAEALSREALAIAARNGDRMGTAWVINGLAAVTAAKGSLERAARLVGFAETAIAEAGGEWPADERAQYDGTLAALEEGLAADELAAGRAAGAAMTADAAVAYAMAEA